MTFSIRRPVVTCVVALLFTPALCFAQYMYLDSNGDGVNTAADCLNRIGIPTIVDVYLVTNHNRDGSSATCTTTNGPLDLFGYVVTFKAVNGTVTYSGFVNRFPSMSTALGQLNPDGIRYKNGYTGVAANAPGSYRICTISITAQAGKPEIQIVDYVQGSADVTSFYCQCWGNDFDNTYKLIGPTGIGSDWHDVDGLGPPPNVPAVLAPDHVTGDTTIDFDVTASASLGDTLASFTCDRSAIPPSDSVSFVVVVDSTLQHGRFRWMRTGGAGSDCLVSFTATNTHGYSTTKSVTIHLVPDRPPLLSAPASVMKRQNRSNVISISVADPDGDTIWDLSADTSAFPQGAAPSFVVAPDHLSGVLTWWVGPNDTLSYSVSFSARNLLTGGASTELAAGDVAPQITAPATVAAAKTGPVSIAVSAFDPNGDRIDGFTANLSTLPANRGASFVVGAPDEAGRRTGTLIWWPSIADSGSYLVRFTAWNNLQASAVTTCVVQSLPPAARLVTTPTSGIAPLTVTFDGSGSSDPDGAIISYRFEFGDGAMPVAQSAPIATHVYESSGR